MKTHYLLALAAALVCGCSPTANYKDTSLPPEQRAKALLAEMTLEEKVGQLLCPIGFDRWEMQGDSIVMNETFQKDIKERQTGMFWAVFRADPWSQKSLENGLTPRLAARCANIMQRYVIDNTRLGIPLFIAEEAPHGHMAIGSTVFPTGIGLAATFNEEVMERIGAVNAQDIRSEGAHISYGPVLDLARDPRWSRVEETFGEDPYLATRLGAAVVKGTGGGKLTNPHATIATLKHFCAYAVPQGGHNGNGSDVTERDLHENFMPPFQAAVEAGALSVMTSYNSVDGVPSTGNGYLYNELLRKQWGFRGFVVSDLYSIDGLMGAHCVAESTEQAGIMSAEAGVDVDLGANAHATLVESVQKGLISEAIVDAAALNVLKLKFEMGLFENPFVEEDKAEATVGDAASVQLALDAARQSIVLLKNESVLPLSKNQKVAVVGPNADNVYNMLGDYTAPQADGKVITVRQGLAAKVGADRVNYAKGCAIRDTKSNDIAAAVAAARASDVVVAVVGGSSARDFKTSYIATGAAIVNSESVSDMDSGEGYDRATLSLLGLQNDLLAALKATGKPLVVVYIQGRPLDMMWASEQADALVTAWYPGEQGGNALADVLYGDYNPAGRLPMSIPRSVGQIPVHYNRRIPVGHDYMDMSAKPLYSFGHGLSYTQFDYANMQVEKTGTHTFNVNLMVKNVGERDGDEVVQLYLRKRFASTDRPVKQLCGFKRLHLKAGQEAMVTFTLGFNELSLMDRQMKRVVEPGTFDLTAGPSSYNVKLKAEAVVE